MCGIVGYSGDFSGDSIQEAVSIMKHRGPDDFGVYINSEYQVALGHARLSIIDLSPSGHQPMLSIDGSIVIVFNGEIYNFKELKVGLIESGYSFRGDSDTEVLLNLYLRDGIDMLPALNGIFAFSLLDLRSGDMFIARDALGVKPLYVSDCDQGFAFASEIKSLLKITRSDLSLDYNAINRYLTFLWCPGDGTPLNGIKKFPPGSVMRLRNGSVCELRQWYVLPQTVKQTLILNADEAISAVRISLRQAVQRQMVADVKVGAFLSGGLDSSSIVAFARQINPDINCFTIESSGGVDSGEVDDLPYARNVANHLNLKLDVVSVSAKELATKLEDMIWHLDEPLADPAALNVMYISQIARDNGVKVLLSGTGGDDVFTGYRRHTALNYEWLWTWFPKVARKELSFLSSKLNQRSTLGRRINKLFMYASSDLNQRIVGSLIWNQKSGLLPLYSDTMLEAIAECQAELPLIDFLADSPRELGKISRMLALEQRFFLADHNLTYTDKMSMANGVEVRVPFLDLDLLQLAARLPDRYKQNGRTGKWVLKRAMEPYLPRDIIYRPKTGFGAPLRRWIDNELREVVGDYLSFDSLNKRGLFNPLAVQTLINDNRIGRRDNAHCILSLLCIEIWCRKFLDQHKMVV